MSKKTDLMQAAFAMLDNICYLTGQNKPPRDIVNAIRIELKTGAYDDLEDYLAKKGLL